MVKRSGSHWIFQLIRPGAREVFLVGDFNGWACGATPMTQNSAGLWEQVLLLPPGVYRFRYYADGQWLTDYAAYGVQRNPLGEFDSVLLVDELIAPPAILPASRAHRFGSASRQHTVPQHRRFRSKVVTMEVPSAASPRHVAMTAQRQRRLAASPPPSAGPIVNSQPDSQQLAEV